MPTDNIIVLDCNFNLTTKFYSHWQALYDLIRFLIIWWWHTFWVIPVW